MPTTLASVLDSVLVMGVGTLGVPVAFPDVSAFAAQVRHNRSVPGFPFASVGRTVTGQQLFVDRAMLPPAKLAALDVGAVWQAAYGVPVPLGYRPLVIPNDPTLRFRVLSIIAVLVSLQPTVEQKVREATTRHPGGVNTMPAETHGFADGSVRFSPLL